MKKTWQTFFVSIGLFLMVFLRGGVAQAFPCSLIEHFDGSMWRIAGSPNLGTSDSLTGVSGVPGTNQAWTVGTYYNMVELVLTLIEFYSQQDDHIRSLWPPTVVLMQTPALVATRVP